MEPPALIQTAAALLDACARWRGMPVVGVDTEFVRERTYFPLPALIQVAGGDGVSLIDVPALDDRQALGALLTATTPVKVIHAYAEDMEVLRLAAGCEPAQVFDTQLAGAFAGYGFSLGYRGLVEAMLGITLDKGETRSDWLKRPLRDAQLRYAALDAAYLLPMHEGLAEALDASGRRAWFEEEFEHVRRARERDRQPDRAYLKVKARAQLGANDHAVLRALAKWREEEAMRRDRPRRHVLPDDALLNLARARPEDPGALRAIGGLSDRAASRYGDAIVKVVTEAASRGPGGEDTPIDLRAFAGTMRRSKRIVKREADALELPRELLANRRALEALLRGVLAHGDDGVPAEFLGWRAEVVTPALLDCIHETTV